MIYAKNNTIVPSVTLCDRSSALEVSMVAEQLRSVPDETVLIELNEYQRDVVIAALKREVQAVQNDRTTPHSLKILAIKELTSVLRALGDEVIQGG